MPERLRTWDGHEWVLDPGALFLEFVYTGEFGAGEWRDGIVRNAVQLDAWLAERFDRAIAPITRSELALALELRDCLTRIVKAVVSTTGGQPAGRDLAQLATFAEAPDLPPALPGFETSATPAGAKALSSVARDAVIHLRDSRDRLRNCSGTDCPIVFLDVLRSGRRTWCSMARCGNRAKIKAYRTRQSQE